MMTVRDAVRTLESLGYIKLSHEGSHMKYGRDSERIILVMHSSPKERVNQKTEKQIVNLHVKQLKHGQATITTAS